MDNRINAAYGRQSVDKKDSISIESQLEFCCHELKGGSFKSYTDRGFSGKNTDRPAFQELVRDIKAGLIRRVVVYKLDRISRSIIDFAGMMELFQQYNVEFISSTEKFDTSTPMGRAMLNICIVFAQLERETIQKRVADAYYARSQRGFRAGGQIPYGFNTEPVVMDGVNTKKLVADAGTIGNIKLLYGLYAQPEISFGDVARHFQELGIYFNKGSIQRSHISKLLRNPVYVQADMDVYEFFKSHGAVIVNDAADFTGLNACYLYQGREQEKRKPDSIAGHMLVLAPHEGIVSSDIWLACRRKAQMNKRYQSGRKAVQTWLAGKAKCGRCGFALMSVNGYFRCNKRTEDKGCAGAGKLITAEFEQFIYGEMASKLQNFKTLTKRNKAMGNPKVTALKVELAHVEAEIEKLLESLLGANDILISYANDKIAELDSRKQSLAKQLADFTADNISPDRMFRITELLEDWESASLQSRREVADCLISKVSAVSGDVNIQWKI